LQAASLTTMSSCIVTKCNDDGVVIACRSRSTVCEMW